MNGYPDNSCNYNRLLPTKVLPPCETPKMEWMELAVIKYFHPNISYREGSNMEPYDPKLNTLTIWQRFHKSLWWKVTNSIPL